MERLQPKTGARVAAFGLPAAAGMILIAGLFLALILAPRAYSVPSGAPAASQSAGRGALPTEEPGLASSALGGLAADAIAGVRVANVGGVKTTSDPATIANKVVQVLAGYASNSANLGRATVPVKLQSITAVRASSIRSVEPQAGAPDAGSADDEVVWVVRAQGPFIGLHVPIGRAPILKDTGYFVIDDATQTVVGMGMP